MTELLTGVAFARCRDLNNVYLLLGGLVTTAGHDREVEV